MPMNRYEIRNEYSLADLQLYTTADKEDPEALLEGVAMAGLVGLLRQLGDLAEFAAEIFHELHEEVMVAASRGHNLKSRVQQLEAELPLIEKSFLSQTDHFLSLYNGGIDWHPNVRMDSNLVTRGDLPRFVMDSYEECRGPPRLFLLDKFDVAGDGACLKRYTDPSFFKLETSSTKMNGKDVQREKKARKAKKKGTRLRNGVAPEGLPHAKLHQLFMEEHAENGERSNTRRVKLKRRISGFPFDLKTGQSYMDKLLKTPSPEPKVIHEDSSDLSPLLILPDSNAGIHEVSQLSDSPKAYDWVTNEKDVTVDEEKVTEDSFVGYLSDDISSEFDNFVDASMTMESEIDTDSELRTKNDRISGLDKQPTASSRDSNKEQIHFNSLASQSTGNAVVFENGIYACKKELSSTSLLDHSSSAYSTKSENSVHAENFPSRDGPGNGGSDISSYQNIVMEDVSVACQPKSVVSGDPPIGPPSMTSQNADSEELLSGQPSCIDLVTSIIVADSPVAEQPKNVLSDGLRVTPNVFSSNSVDFEQLTAGQCHPDFVTMQGDCDSGVVLKEVISRGLELDAKSSILDEETKRTDHTIEPSCSPSFSDSDSRSGSNYQISYPPLHDVYESNKQNVTSTSTASDFLSHISDSATAMSTDFLQEDYSDQEDHRGPEQAEKLSLLDEEQKENHLIDLACSFSISDSELLLGDNSPTSSSGGTSASNSNSENKRCMSTVLDIVPYPETSTASSDLLLQMNTGLENPNLGENLSSMPSSCTLPPTATNLTPPISVDNPIKDDFRDGDQMLSENSRNNHPFNAFNEDSFKVGLSKKELSNYGSDEESGNMFLVEKEVDKSLSGNSAIIDIKEQDADKLGFSHIGSPDSNVLHLERSQNLPTTSLDGDGKDGVICDGETIANETPETEIQKSVGVKINETVSTSASAYLESSSYATGNIESMKETTDTAETAEGILYGISNVQDANIISVTPTIASVYGVSVLPNEPDLKTTISDAVIVDSSSPALVDSIGIKTLSSSVLDKLVEEDSSADEVDRGKNVPSLDRKEISSFEEVTERGIAPWGRDRDFSYTENIGHSNPDVSGEVHSDVHFGVKLKSVSTEEGLSLAAEQKCKKQIGISSGALNSNNAVDIACQVGTDPQPYPLSSIPHLDSVESNAELVSLTRPDHGILDLANDQVSTSSTLKCSVLDSTIRPVALGSEPHSDVLGDCKAPLFPMFSLSNHLLDANSDDMEELPPLPPLPPVQWRIGKVHHPSSFLPTEPFQHVLGISAPFESLDQVCSVHEESNHSQVEIEHTVDHSSSVDAAVIKHESSSVDAAVIKHESSSVDAAVIKHESSSVDAAVIKHETIDLLKAKENKQQVVTVSTPEHELELPDIDDVKTRSEIPSRTEEVESSLTSLDIPSLMKETLVLKQSTENEKREFTIPSLDGESSMPVVEDAKANAIQKWKLLLPRDPLMDDVVAIDKSKLRKVSERVIPELPKVEERDSILEQIRTRSFNLKPALTTRPSIRGPKTNLNVTAILEKANAIRQALADSDEDEDSWSDS